jgi:hypothetical protein
MARSGMISFMHSGGESMASFRYRAKMPAIELAADINNYKALVHIYSKPVVEDVEHAKKAKLDGKIVIVDYCDLHFDQYHYRHMLKFADLVTCNTQWTKEYLLSDFGVDAFVIPEPFEHDEQEPHFNGNKVLWFGNSGNYDSFLRVKDYLKDYPITVVCNVSGCIPWSHENLKKALCENNIVILPETAPYKSANRAVESIRSGCFVVAEPHPSLTDFPVYIGNLKEGIEWALKNPHLANLKIKTAQDFIKERLSPKTLANAWRIAIQKAQLNSTSDQGITIGMVG